MFLNYSIILNCINYLMCYTLFISQIPQSNSLRIGITTPNLTYINTYNNFKLYDDTNKSHRKTDESKFKLKASKVDEILESLKNLTLLETSELVKKIEETFGISSSVLPQQPLTLVPQATAPQEAFKDDEEDDMEARQMDRKREHTVIIKEIKKDSLYPAYKALKQYYNNLSALDVKKIMDSLPYTVKTVRTMKEAQEIVKKLTADGMTIEIE